MTQASPLGRVAAVPADHTEPRPRRLLGILKRFDQVRTDIALGVAPPTERMKSKSPGAGG
jgi:hypothetical protein